MAAQSYYTSKSYRQDHQHLLSPSLSSPGFSSGQPSPVFSSGQPSPLKPMHLVHQDQSEQYQHTPAFNDFEHLKQAQRDDAVRLSTSSTTSLHRKPSTLTEPSTSKLVSADFASSPASPPSPSPSPSSSPLP